MYPYRELGKRQRVYPLACIFPYGEKSEGAREHAPALIRHVDEQCLLPMAVGERLADKAFHDGVIELRQPITCWRCAHDAGIRPFRRCIWRNGKNFLTIAVNSGQICL